MTEYIERERALQFHLKAYVKPEKFSVAQAVADAIAEYIKVIPAADVVPVVHGRWETKDRLSLCSCSICGKVAPYDVAADTITYWPLLNYCPNCGASMVDEDGEA